MNKNESGFLMQLPAQILKAAKICQAKNDVRFYLKGILIGQKYIAATDGHKAFCFDHTINETIIPPEKDLIINIIGTIPKGADKGLLYRVDDKFGYIQFHIRRKSLKDSIVRLFVEFVGGDFPDIERIIPKEKPKGTESILISKDYLIEASKCLSIASNQVGVRMDFHGSNQSAVFSADTRDGRAFVIVMPMRD